ncbi:pre-rRNA-processing protein TSR1 homolog, partial [Stegodyphus dumicola]|uniref:pre-rRNA-processing protein TSR1 homolog n=1 Tax=Stegodyphus dumicola TaxID=202533 RepID=UPI0015AFFC80
KVDVKTLSRHKKHDLNRIDRKNKLSQIRKAKREEVVMQKRGLGGVNSPPILTVILPLNDTIDAEKFLDDMKNCDDDNLLVINNKFGHCHVSSSRLKQRFTFLIPNTKDLISVMDAMKVADVLVLIHSSDPPDDNKNMLLSVIIAHALPTTIHVVQGLEKLNPKKKAECRKHILKTLEKRFPDEKLHSADTKQEFQLLLRQIGCQKQRPVAFRDARFHLLAENIEYDPTLDNGTLKVSGYVRGKPLNVNGLVHIPGWGDFQMSQVDYENDPHPFANKAKPGVHKDVEMASDNVLFSNKPNPSEQESLQSEVIPDPMEGEQTWPTEEELNAAMLTPKKKVKKVAEGTSDYQASWILNSDDDDASESSEDESYDEDQSGSEAVGDVEMDDVESVPELKDENYDKQLDLDEEKKMLVRFKEERLNQMFPDELDTPIDISARVRFQRYRGLESFKKSVWDPLENLPPDYSRIYMFGSFKQTKKKVLTEEKEGAMPGLYVTMHIINVPQSLYENTEKSPFVVYGLLPHEQKMSVVNVIIRKQTSCQTPVKSKDTLIFHVGYRRFTCQPIFSEHNHIGDKFKYERFLPHDEPAVASFYAPVIFPPASVTVFRQCQDGSHELIATGSVLDANPKRIIIKRIVLSGHPFKIFKRSAVVRYMFFNKEDINWFKKIKLRTKCGNIGNIIQSLGSHGHMKCVFEKQLQSQDVVLMYLYKRIFPKWTYDPYIPTPTTISVANDVEML